MFLRILILLPLASMLGCSAASVAETPVPHSGDAAAALRTLTVEGTEDRTLFPNSTTELAVRYRDSGGGSVAGVEVDFALTGVPGGSLTPSRAFTDEFGVARTILRVGSMPGELQVRADAGDASPVYVRVSVGEARSSTLSVRVSYRGAREVTSYTVSALDQMTCERALAIGVAGDVVHRFQGSGESVEFDLGPGLRAAIVAWGRDETGGRLARGCVGYEAPITADRELAQANLTVVLEDTPMRVESALPVELELNVLSSAKRLADGAQRAVERVLAPSGGAAMFADADYYLDAVAALMEQRGNSAALSGLAQLRQTTSLSASLNPALAQAGAGPKAVGTRVGQLFGARGAAIVLSTTYEAGALSALGGLSARSADGVSSLELGPAPAASLSAQFDESRAKLAFAELRVQLGLGVYGQLLLDAMQSDPAVKLAASLEQAAGCEVVGSWAKVNLAAICDAESALQACRTAVGELTAAIRQALPALDAEGGAIRLRGDVQVHDRSEDGVVDDLGPSPLSGETWGTDATVLGELHSPGAVLTL